MGHRNYLERPILIPELLLNFREEPYRQVSINGALFEVQLEGGRAAKGVMRLRLPQREVTLGRAPLPGPRLHEKALAL
jgi:hypothetical protein